MRIMFGLVSLLICTAIIVYLFTLNTETAVKTSEAMKPQVEQISGRSVDGTPVDKSFVTEPESDPSGRYKDLLVKSVVSGGGMDTFYGLKVGDQIVQVESLTREELSSGEAMRDMLVDAYQKSQPIVVIREGKPVTLPLTGAAAHPAAPAPGAGPATAPSPSDASPNAVTIPGQMPQ